jgi:2-C-methyl-D-erythritol 4-phosphate cytidylyltransferase
MTPELHVLIPAAGSGQRFASDIPKQYATFLDLFLLDHSVDQLIRLVAPKNLIVGLAEDDPLWSKTQASQSSAVKSVIGGTTRAETVFNMISALENIEADDWVLVHDAVRPCINSTGLKPLLDALLSTGASGISLGQQVNQAVKRVSEQGTVIRSEIREGLWLTHTPQVFRYSALLESMQGCMQEGLSFDDEMMALHHFGFATEMVEGSALNIKITEPDDLRLAENYWKIMQSQSGETNL